MQTTLFMAMSVNGYIARENGEEDFLSDRNWDSFCEIAREHGNFIIGRKTYEAVGQWDTGYGFGDLKGIEKVILSQAAFSAEGYKIAGSPRAALDYLKEKGFEKILITGGATVNSAFMKEGLIDFIKLNIEPYLLGQGIPLLAPQPYASPLKLLAAKRLPGGILQNHYAVIK